MKKKLLLIIIFLSFSGCLERPRTNVEQNNSLFGVNIVNIAKSHLGKPYRYGQTGPKSFDCSGFVYGVFKSVNVPLPRTSLDQSKISGSKLYKRDLTIGDLVFFDTSGRGHVNHSGIYIGGSQFIHASSGKAYSVTISDMNGWYRDKFKWGKRVRK
ncbi:MAG: C40 family peptidase [Epsilonproteobacteria bacterium]|nr:C40 family peptidase [Campylobacterota bacterium]